MKTQITHNQWRELDGGQKIETLTRLERKSFIPLLKIEDMQELLDSKEEDCNTLFKELKKIDTPILNKQQELASEELNNNLNANK